MLMSWSSGSTVDRSELRARGDAGLEKAGPLVKCKMARIENVYFGVGRVVHVRVGFSTWLTGALRPRRNRGTSPTSGGVKQLAGNSSHPQLSLVLRGSDRSGVIRQ